MTGERVERRLAAILAADVVGYSRLVSADEADALTRLGTLRRAIIEPNIANHSGRLFKIMDDGFLAGRALGQSVEIDPQRSSHVLKYTVLDQPQRLPDAEFRQIHYRIRSFGGGHAAT